MSSAAASSAAFLIRRRCGCLLDPLMRRAFSTQTLTQLDIKQTQSQNQIHTSSHSGNLDLGPRSFLSQALTRRTNKVMGGRVPRMLLPSETNPHSCSVFTLSIEVDGDGAGRNNNILKYEREMDLPRNADPTAKSCFIGSTEGILFTTPRKEKSTEMLAFDPLTRTLLRLPSPDTLAYCLGAFCLQNAKVLLSPSRDILVINHLQKAEYACRAPRGWGSWRALPQAELHVDDEDCEPECEPVHDFIFHKGLLYAVDTLGTLTIYDFNNPSSSSEEKEKEPTFSHSGSPELRCYGEDFHTSCLVESPDGNDLFLVYRLDSSEFMVFKLNSEGNWARVSTIGDMAIFMGINQSVSLHATDFPDILKPNSIYFTERERDSSSGSHAGVFSLENETVRFFRVTTSCQDVLNRPRWEQPVWFTPATTS